MFSEQSDYLLHSPSSKYQIKATLVRWGVSQMFFAVGQDRLNSNVILPIEFMICLSV